jgi:hypothetical protein
MRPLLFILPCAMLSTIWVTGCGAADDVSEGAARAGEAIEEVERLVTGRVCVVDEAGVCPLIEDAMPLLELVVDDCHEIVTIDAGPDAECCFELTLELTVEAAIELASCG